MNLQVNKKYEVKCSRGSGVVIVLNTLEDAEGEVVDCRVVEGEFKTTIPNLSKVRKMNDYICLRPDGCEWKPYSSFS